MCSFGQLWQGTGFVIQLVDSANLKKRPLNPLDLLVGTWWWPVGQFEGDHKPQRNQKKRQRMKTLLLFLGKAKVFVSTSS